MSYEDAHRYDDMLDLPPHRSRLHKQMPNIERAAQFAPFAALKGYEEKIAESSRLTEERIDLSESALEELDDKMRILEDCRENVQIRIRYFTEDGKKEGGSYRTAEIYFYRIVYDKGYLEGTDGTRIPLHDIFTIESDIFDI